MIELLIHQWKEKTRSPFWQKSIFINIILVLLGLYFIFSFIIISFFSDKIIESSYPGEEVTVVFTGLLLYYFLFDIILRFFMQQLPVVSAQPYLLLAVKRSQLIKYTIIKSFIHFINLLAILLILPFFFKNVLPAYHGAFAFNWLFIALSIIAINNLLNFSLKKYFSQKPWLIAILLVLVAGLGGLAEQLSLAEGFSGLWMATASLQLGFVIPGSLIIILALFTFHILKDSFYSDSNSTVQNRKTLEWSMLDSFGLQGDLLKIEIRLMLRNKRVRNQTLMFCFFLLYGFIFYTERNLGMQSMLILTGMLLTIIVASSYGQYFFSLDGQFFDFYLTSNLPLEDYIRTKFLLFGLLCFASYILTLPYALIDPKIGFINTAMVLWNIGITSWLFMIACTYNKPAFDLEGSAMMNYQGTGFGHFIGVIPVLFLPFIIHLVFRLTGMGGYSLIFFATMGLLGIVFHRFGISLVKAQLLRRKLIMAAGFRKK
ncbi:MAG: hypothetical protein EA361_04040 [Bacteroidetes bacterium]|nr:MAG: hypothetical protein EA361_04040 [Bacteroidota bacterium]